MRKMPRVDGRQREVRRLLCVRRYAFHDYRLMHTLPKCFPSAKYLYALCKSSKSNVCLVSRVAAELYLNTHLVDDWLDTAVLKSGRHHFELLSIADEYSSNIGGTIEDGLREIWTSARAAGVISHLRPRCVEESACSRSYTLQ